MSSFTQQQFLGASIRYFNINLGWGNDETVLEIGLVEDPRLDEHFAPELPGTLIRFEYKINEGQSDEYTWQFDGIINNYKIRRDQSGNRVIDVTMTDPRKILSGVQLILNGYNGSTYSLPNLYNVFGHLESIAYGYAQVNDSGIPASKVVESLNTLLNTTLISFGSMVFNFDITTLPPINPAYRVSGDNMSLMDFISDVCETANVEFFIECIGNTIKLRWVPKNYQYEIGAIDRFINTFSSTPTSIDQGLELEQNTCTKMLVGGQVEENLLVTSNIQNALIYNDSEERYEVPLYNTKQFYENEDLEVFLGQNIWPYWGLDANRNAILGRGLDFNHKVLLDGRSLVFPGIDFSSGYPTDYQEMVAANIGIDNWKALLDVTNQRPIDSNTNEPYEDPQSVHEGKLSRMGLQLSIKQKFLELLFQDPNKAKQLLAKDTSALTVNDFVDIDKQQLEIMSRIFSFVETYAKEYFGRKFMVKIPNLLSKIDLDTLEVKTSIEPVTSGYLDQVSESLAVRNGIIPTFSDFVKDSDGKIICYVRFDGWLSGTNISYRLVEGATSGVQILGNLDISELDPEEVLIQGDYIYVKAEVDPEVVFIDRRNLLHPRVVITLPGKVINRTNSSSDSFIAWIQNKVDALKHGQKDSEPFKVGDNILRNPSEMYPVLPQLVSVPMRDNYRTYGPWYNNTSNKGMVEFEKNEELVPWNFNGFGPMNVAGLSLVSDISINTMYGENGSITVPGTPTLNVGQQLIDRGPYITGIHVGFDADGGVTTTYQMKKWAHQLGKMNRQSIDTYKKFNKIISEKNRILRKVYKPNKPLINAGNRKVKDIIYSKLKAPKTPHHIIVGEVIEQNSRKVPVVTTMPLSEAQLYLASGTLEQRAGCSLDALFYPFSLDSGNTKLPKIGTITYSGSFNTGRRLNLYSGQYNVGSYLNGVMNASGEFDQVYDMNNDFLSGDLSIINRPGARTLGLRNPLYLVDAKYTGTPKAGPLDTQFDEGRQVWVSDAPIAGIAVVVSGIAASGIGTARLLSSNLDQKVYHDKITSSPGGTTLAGILSSTSELIYLANFDSTSLSDGQLVQVLNTGSVWSVSYVYCNTYFY